MESEGVTDAKASFGSDELVFSTLGVTTKLSDHYNDQTRDGIVTPTIIFTGVRKSDGQTFTFIAKVKPEQFQASKKEVPVTGVLIEGSMIAFFTMLAINPGAMKLIGGSVQFDEASMDDNSVIAGKADLEIVGFSQKKAEKTAWVSE